MTILNERAMLVSLHISSWAGMMHDREVTDATNEDFKASKEAGRYNKRLVGSQFLRSISTAHSRASTTHKLLTLPWEDDGTRILPSVGYIVYTDKMRECRRNAEAAVKAFLENPNDYINEAKTRLGDMFNRDDYPPVDELKKKFGFDVEIKPMPDAADFRAKLTDDQTKAIVKDMERRTNQRLETAMGAIFKRVHDMVGRMSERLRNYTPPKDGNKAEGIIRDSIVYDIHELAKDILPALNITNDPRITELQKQLLSDLVEHSPEILRADAKVRAQTLSKADKLLKKVQGYMK